MIGPHCTGTWLIHTVHQTLLFLQKWVWLVRLIIALGIAWLSIATLAVVWPPRELAVVSCLRVGSDATATPVHALLTSKTLAFSPIN